MFDTCKTDFIQIANVWIKTLRIHKIHYLNFSRAIPCCFGDTSDAGVGWNGDGDERRKIYSFQKRPHLSGNGKVHCINLVCLSWPDTQGASLLPTLWICTPQFHVFPPVYPGQPQPAVSPWAAQSWVLRTCLKLGNATDSNLWTIRRWSGLGSAAVGGHFPGGSLSKFDNQTPDTLYNLHLTIF